MKKEYGGIILNPYCSNYCVFCRRVPRASMTELKQQEINIYKNLIDLKRRGIRKIDISGADPIEYPELTPLVKYIKKIGFEFVQLSTHGKKLADKKFANALIKAGVDKFRIPLYGHIAKVHDSVTRKEGSFNATIKGIRNILKLAPRLQIQLSSLVVRQNKDYLIYIVKLAQKLKIKDFYFSFPLLKNKDDSYYTPIKDLGPYLEKVDSYGRRVSYSINFMEIPFCVFGRIAHSINNTSLPPDQGLYCQPIKELRTSIKDLPSYRLKKKLEMCNICRANDVCDGFISNDINKYGIGNLLPII